MTIRVKGVGATTVITDDYAPVAVVTMNSQRGWPYALHWNDPRTGEARRALLANMDEAFGVLRENNIIKEQPHAT